MSLREKYNPVIQLCEELQVKDGTWKEEANKVKMGCVTNTAYERDIIWDKIKEVGGGIPKDFEADIKPANEEHYHVHTVVHGDTLWGLSEKYYGNGGHYKRIHAANPDVVDENPNVIRIGWVLNIPHKEQG